MALYVMDDIILDNYSWFVREHKSPAVSPVLHHIVDFVEMWWFFQQRCPVTKLPSTDIPE
jgi:hypothetical protein